MIDILESIAKKELYMGYIFGIMIIGGYIRQYHVLDDVYSLAKRYIKDARIMIIITSLIGGVLPIPGRVALSAPLLDAIAPPDKKKRSENDEYVRHLSVEKIPFITPKFPMIYVPISNIIEPCLV